MSVPEPYKDVSDSSVKTIQSILINFPLGNKNPIQLSRIACYDINGKNISLESAKTVAYSNNQIPGLAYDGFGTDYSKGSFYAVYGTYWKTFPPSNVTKPDLFAKSAWDDSFWSRATNSGPQWLLVVFPIPYQISKIVIYNSLDGYNTKDTSGNIVTAKEIKDYSKLIPFGLTNTVGLQVSAYSTNILSDLNAQTTAGYNMPLATPVWARTINFYSDGFQLGVNGDGKIIGYLPGSEESESKPTVVSYAFTLAPPTQPATPINVRAEGTPSTEPAPAPAPKPVQVTTKSPSPASSDMMMIYIIIAVVLLLLIGGGVYYFKFRK